MLSLFIAVGTTLLDGGLTVSLIRTVDADERDFSTIFYFNLAGSIALYLILFFAAPLIAGFYNQPLLKEIVRVYGLTLIINAFYGVQSTLLIKSLKFRKQTNIQIFYFDDKQHFLNCVRLRPFYSPQRIKKNTTQNRMIILQPILQDRIIYKII